VVDNLARAVAELKREESLAEVRRLLQAGRDPFDLIERGLMPGLDLVGERFERGEYFLPQLLLAGQVVEECSALIRPRLASDQAETKGTVVLGTVAGDVHDLGKNIVGTTLRSGGFRVVDLGVDVPRPEFIEAVRREGASLLGMSALLTTTMVEMAQVIEALRAEPDLAGVRVMVGGAPLDEDYAARIGADAFGGNARQALLRARELIGREPACPQ